MDGHVRETRWPDVFAGKSLCRCGQPGRTTENRKEAPMTFIMIAEAPGADASFIDGMKAAGVADTLAKGLFVAEGGHGVTGWARRG